MFEGFSNQELDTDRGVIFARAGIDREHDDAGAGVRCIEAPLLALWSASGALPRLYGDVLAVWRPWARHESDRGILASHFLIDDEPEQIADLLAMHVSGEPSHVR